MEHRRDPRRLLARPRRQRGQQLQACRRHLRREPQVGGGLGQPGEEQRPRLALAHAGEAGAVAVEQRVPDEEAHHRHLAEVQAHAREEVLPGIEREQTASPQVLRLAPTARSLVR
ncbi:hypothetical protein [Actinomadura hibisca]|uniref:hypothetical protein n=1 Tax=Actinomadura hibisca TaxID=68565 RepID=UPI001FDEB558|nr:hypothetical protein [Actinomadura hibisca]